MSAIMQCCIWFCSDHYYTGILRVISRKITNKRSLVNTGTIFYISICYVSRSCFSRYGEGISLNARSCSFRYHASILSLAAFITCGLAILSSITVGPYCLTIMPSSLNTIYQIRFHHLTVVGNGIIKCECMHGTYLYSITKTHRDHIHYTALVFIQWRQLWLGNIGRSIGERASM